MLTTIELDGNLCSRTVKVQDEWPELMLATKISREPTDGSAGRSRVRARRPSIVCEDF
jgi:hypothetical protein